MSDLISRKVAIDSLTEIIMNLKNVYGDMGSAINGARECIKSLPSVEPERKWIPVTEALPKDTEFVLLTIRRLDKSYNQTPFISVGYISWNQSAWWCAHDGDCDSHNVEVLAWMPLPESYKGD